MNKRAAAPQSTIDRLTDRRRGLRGPAVAPHPFVPTLARQELVMSLFMTMEMLIQSFAAMSAQWRGFREMVPTLIMKTSSASQPQFVSWFSIAPRVVHFAALMKRR